jgi:uncharacterized membrane protein
MTDERTPRVAGLIAILGGSGVLHMLVPAPYERIVPPGFGDPRTMVYLSGVAELGCAALLASRRTRRTGGLLSAGLFVGVFPANLYAVKIMGNRLTKAAAVARLPLQLPMITAALRVAREPDASGS